MYYFQYSIFTTTNEQIKLSEEKFPDVLEAINNDKVSSTTRLYELFRGEKSNGTASVQYLRALNVFMGGSKEQSRNVMSELMRNFVVQAFNKSNLTLELDFIVIFRMMREIDRLCVKRNKAGCRFC